MANKTASFLFALSVPFLAGQASAQIIDDKMMPPVLVMPELSDEDTGMFGTTEDNLSEQPLSVIEVPILDIQDQEDDEQTEKPVLVGSFSLLHKVTAKVQQIELLSGQEYAIGDLSFTMQDCISAPPEEPPETKTFLQISEFQSGRDRALFSGWMFASSPGINALEHPVYDLWPLACKTEDGLAFTGEILPPITEGDTPIVTQ